MKSIICLGLALCWVRLAAATDVIRVAQDFEAGFRPAGKLSPGVNAERSSETPFGASCLKITVASDFAWTRPDGTPAPIDAFRVALLSNPHLPPETDAIRMRVRVVSGRAILSVGGPVSQIGSSDVFCDPHLVEPQGADEWQVVEFSLNHPIARNFRRANLSRDLPVIYYTRWAQEPMTLENYLAMKHCVVSFSEQHTPGFVDRFLAERGQKRNIRVRVAYFLAAAQIVANSDLVVTLPRQLGLHLEQQQSNLKTLPLPLEVPPFSIFLYWHIRNQLNPIHSWLRELFSPEDSIL